MLSSSSRSSVTALLCRLYEHINQRRRWQLVLLLALTALSSIAEVVSLGAVVPFIGILTQPERVFSNAHVFPLAQQLGITSPGELVLPLTAAFAAAAIIAGVLRLLLLWISIRLANAMGADLSVEVYRRTLYQPYHVHVARSSSEIISGITQKVGTATAVLTSVVTVITSAAILAAILVTLLFIDPLVASFAMASFGVCYGLIARMTRRRLASNSVCIAEQQTAVVKSLQEGLGSIRDVLLDGTQTVYCDVYKKSVLELQKATGENQYITLAPRFVMEALGMVMIAVFAYALSYRAGGIGAALPVLGALALGAQRLLPLLQQLYGNWSFMAGSHAALSDVLQLLEQPLPDDAHAPAAEPLDFQREIAFENVGFRYPGTGPWVLNGINLKIRKGARVGFIGRTGSGKSTALDLLMSLLEPVEGRILVDGQPVCGQRRRAWQRTIAHVPQSIYLADATVAENIAFGMPPAEIDMERVRRAAEQAHVAEFIEARPGGYAAIVGERGVRLSGGQRQRIGIARALYKQATVLVFDEATSALDTETERDVMEAVDDLGRDLTILIIAHRLSTLHSCDEIIELGSGRATPLSTPRLVADYTERAR